MEDKKLLVVLNNKMDIKTNDSTTIEIPTNGDDIVLIDNADNIKKLFNSYSWITDSKGYPVTKINRKDTRLHQLIINKCFGNDYVPTQDTGLVIDHLNNNHCDNRLRNLHILPIKSNNDKELLDFNFDNISVYIEYDYNFKKMLLSNNNNKYTPEQIKEIYNNRKYVLGYISSDIVLFSQNKEEEPFNIFELVYDNYDSFIKDIKKISLKTKEFRRVARLVQKNSQSKDLKKIKDIKDIRLNKQRLEKQKENIIEVLNKHEWQDIRNVHFNMLSKQEFMQLSEDEKLFYMNLKDTVYQYLPPNFNIKKF